GVTKQGLEVLAQAAGIVETTTRLIPQHELPGTKEFGYRATVKIRRSDGTIEAITRDRMWDGENEYESIVESVHDLAAKYPGDWNQQRVEKEVKKRWRF